MNTQVLKSATELHQGYDRVDKENIGEVAIRDAIGRMQNTPIINESG